MPRALSLCLTAILCTVAASSATAQQSADTSGGSTYTVLVQPKGSRKAAKPQPISQPRTMQPTGNLPRPSQLPQAAAPLAAPSQQPSYLPQPSSSPAHHAYGQPSSAPATYAPLANNAAGGNSATFMAMPKGYKGKAPRPVPMEAPVATGYSAPVSQPLPRGKGSPDSRPTMDSRANTATHSSTPSPGHSNSTVRGAMVAPPGAPTYVPAAAPTAAQGRALASADTGSDPITGLPLRTGGTSPGIDTRAAALKKKPVVKREPVVRATRTRDLPEGYDPNPPDEAMLKRDRLRWDGEYELDRLERPQLDSTGKVIPVLYMKNGKAVRPRNVKLAKLHPATIQNGVLTVDGWTSKGRMNYAVQDLKFLYFSVPGLGTIIVSPENFGGAEEQADAFNGLTVKVTSGDHEVQLVTEKPILTKNSLPAYVRVDKDYIHDRKAPVMGYGGFENAPYLWPGAVKGQAMQGSLDAPDLPKNMLPAMRGSVCDSRTSRGCEPTAKETGRPSWAIDPDAKDDGKDDAGEAKDAAPATGDATPVPSKKPAADSTAPPTSIKSKPTPVATSTIPATSVTQP